MGTAWLVVLMQLNRNGVLSGCSGLSCLLFGTLVESLEAITNFCVP